MEDWYDKKADYHVLGLAANYIEQARFKDPNVKLSIEIKKGPDKGEFETVTPDDLSGTALFYESQRYSQADASAQSLQQARDLLIRAIAYRPSSVQLRQHLAKVYLNLHDKQSSLAIAEEAVRRRPKDLDARKLLDFVRAAPVTQPPTIVDTNPGLFFSLIALILFVIAIVVAIFASFTTGLGIFVIAAITIWIGSTFENSQMLQKAIEKRAKEQANNR